MSSTDFNPPASLAGKRSSDHLHQEGQQHNPPLTPHFLSSRFIQSNSASPTLNDINTPADSILSIHYQSSIYSELADDPFCGHNFNATEGVSPSFLDGEDGMTFIGDQSFTSPLGQSSDASLNILYPLSPDHTPSLQAHSPSTGHSGLPQTNNNTQFPPASVSPYELSKPFGRPAYQTGLNDQRGYTFTPSNSGSGRSSDDGLTAASHVMPLQSPQVTVSVWDNNDEGVKPVSSAEESIVPRDMLDAASTMAATDSVRDGDGSWLRDEPIDRGGIAPEDRPTTEVPSINEATAERKIAEKNLEVSEWVNESVSQAEPTDQPRVEKPHIDNDNISPKEIPLGDQTENKVLSGQIYFLPDGGEMTANDIRIMKENRNFADAPMLPNTYTDRHQPYTSDEAARLYQQRIRDIDQNSMLSRAATWGTRRHSFSVADREYEEELSGNFLRKMNLGKPEERERRPSFVSRVSSLVKRQSVNSKRARPSIPEGRTSQDQGQSPGQRRESRDSLKPPSRTDSGEMGIQAKKQSVPSINTALFSMGASVASIGSTTHARSGSISNTPTVTSPKSPNTLSVAGFKNVLGRRRSHSEIANMMRKTGGPPVAKLVTTTSAPEASAVQPLQPPASAQQPDVDSDDDEEDSYEEAAENKAENKEANKLIDDMEPTLAGFREHVLKLNPRLKEKDTWLADRIAHHQVTRYKLLLNLRIKHLNIVANQKCSSGPLCIAQGGSANPVAGKRDAQHEALSAGPNHEISEDEGSPLEGALTPECFPQDIPMPPTASLPAELECQLCFQAKRFNKPSDWTKHVHEDVQPFTCTFDHCSQPKTFKRKADWVRHENEGHRHLEWWKCDVGDCVHKCFRRDNFLQHLVREHKFIEPKVKTKAAIKKAGVSNPTWQKVEQCKEETKRQPNQEECRFCEQRFPTWKKLTVHLAKHMEQISLPVLRLVARKELQADTIISPVQDPPPRTFPITTSAFSPNTIKSEQYHQFNHSPMVGQGQGFPRGGGMNFSPQHHNGFHHPMMAAQMVPHHVGPQPPYHSQQQQQQAFYGPGAQQQQYTGLGQSLDSQLHNIPVNQGFVNAHGYGGMPVTTGYMAPSVYPYVTVAPDTEPFPSFNGLGLQDMQGPLGADQMSYNNGLMDPSGAGTHHYTPHGSASPFSHSPYQGQGSFN